MPGEIESTVLFLILSRMVRDTKTKPEPKEIVTDVKLVRQRRRVDNVVLTDFRIKIKARLEHPKRYEKGSNQNVCVFVCVDRPFTT